MFRAAVLSRQGSGRRINQDRAIVNNRIVGGNDGLGRGMFTVTAPGLVAVFDGLGGHPAGHIASQTAAELIATNVTRLRTRDDLKDTVEAANVALYEQMMVSPGLASMGTTVAGVFITPNGRMLVFWVGDSRVYQHTSSGGLRQLTADDYEDDAITQTLGGQWEFQPINVHTIWAPPADDEGGRIVAATDGMSADPYELDEALRDCPLRLAPGRLADVASRSGNTDDCTIAVIQPGHG